jgi:drug/metabolite transporter (DMT)-like permease
VKSTDAQDDTGNVTRPDTLTLAVFALIVVLGGANGVAIRFTVLELPPFWGAAVRFAAAALCFWAILLARRLPLPAARTLVGVLLFGLLDTGASFAFVYWGLRSMPAGLASVLLALAPLLTFFFAIAHRLEPFRWRGLVGGVLAVAGITLAFVEQPNTRVPLGSVLALLAGTACLAEATVVVKWLPQVHPVVLNALAMSTGTGMLLACSLLAGEQWQLPALPPTWAAILYLVICGSVVLFYLFLFLVRRWTASATSYLFVLFPFVTVVLAAWLAHETVTAAFLGGGVLVLVGVWVGTLARP